MYFLNYYLCVTHSVFKAFARMLMQSSVKTVLGHQTSFIVFAAPKHLHAFMHLFTQQNKCPLHGHGGLVLPRKPYFYGNYEMGKQNRGKLSLSKGGGCAQQICVFGVSYNGILAC